MWKKKERWAAAALLLAMVVVTGLCWYILYIRQQFYDEGTRNLLETYEQVDKAFTIFSRSNWNMLNEWGKSLQAANEEGLAEERLRSYEAEREIWRYSSVYLFNENCEYWSIRGKHEKVDHLWTAFEEMYRTGKKIELLAAYEPCFRFMSEWWKQLYGESEGKENKGLFPASVEFTADLHSMGQYIQQGERHLFETVVRFGASKNENPVPFDEGNGDGLNFLAGKSMDFICRQAMDGTLLAHVEGGVPNVTLQTGSLNEQTLGGLIYFFEYACGLSGYLLDVNPFDQPGVEAYKKNMFALLGKPGYEELRSELLRKLEK